MTVEEDPLLSRVAPEIRAINGVPAPEEIARRERAAAAARRVLDGYLRPDGLRVSPLGPGWSRDVDAHVHSWPHDADLRAAGWLPLDGLFVRLGAGTRGRWAVVEDGEVLSGVDLHDTPAPDPVAAILGRCQRREEVRVREALELRTLARAGARLPAGSRAVRAAAAIEAWLGGDALASYRDGPPRSAPVPLPAPGWRRRLRRVRAAFRRRVTVALSGVDGAGKSTVARCVGEELARAGVAVGSVWARPGMNLGSITRVSRLIKRGMGQAQESGVLVVAREEGARLLSRRGLVGWTWSLIVTLAYVADVWRQHLRARGVVVYDRHIADAVVTLEVLYAGPNLALQRALVRLLLPRAELTAHLHVEPETAAARKPGDMIGLRMIHAQLDRYGTEMARVAPLIRLDGTDPPRRNAREIVGRLLELTAAAEAPFDPLPAAWRRHPLRREAIGHDEGKTGS